MSETWEVIFRFSCVFKTATIIKSELMKNIRGIILYYKISHGASTVNIAFLLVV